MTDLADQEEQALARSHDITGWLEEAEARILYRFAVELGTQGPILEIGSWHGKSTIVLATAAKNVGSCVVAVDPHEGINYWQDRFGPMDELGPSLDAFQENLNRAGVSDVVEPVVMTSRRAFDELEGRTPFSFIFIDGNHGYSSVRADFEMWSQRLIVGGVLAFHDSKSKMPGPSQVIAEVKARGDYAYLSLVEQLTSFRKTR